MNVKWISTAWMLVLLITTAYAADPSPSSDLPTEEIPVSLNSVMKGIETRYSGIGFTAQFTQKSTIKAMQITDHAAGTVMIKRPGMMRWEYQTPDKQAIITDGVNLWIYRPEDHQVMVGKAPSYFKGGKGANFLSDIKLIRQDFGVTLEKADDSTYWKLLLVPKERKYDVALVRLSVSKATYDLVHIVTVNSYGDETLIELSGFEFNKNPPDSDFRFDIPEGIDILKLED